MFLKEKVGSLTNNIGFKHPFSNTSWLFGRLLVRICVAVFAGFETGRFLDVEMMGAAGSSVILSFILLVNFMIRYSNILTKIKPILRWDY